MQFLGEEPGDYVEIFVVMGGEPTRVTLAASGVQPGEARWVAIFEFVGAQHFLFY